MLPKTNRLKSLSDFKKVFRLGKISENPVIKVKYALNNQNYSRFGFVVGIKTAKKASDRNLIKRRLRAAASVLLKDLKPGFDIVVWPKTGRQDFGILLENLKNLLIKNDILPF